MAEKTKHVTSAQLDSSEALQKPLREASTVSVTHTHTHTCTHVHTHTHTYIHTPYVTHRSLY